MTRLDLFGTTRKRNQVTRSIDGKSERAYRVVRLDKEGKPFPPEVYDTHYGPYSTLSAAKGKRTTLQRYGSQKYIIEQTPAGWSKVDV